ncbi:PQQ-dependent sugar dehydrogenase [Aurantimonas aggregata]|uniref:PQQ-dependent sugar dehydrogenase n=1 Tax=Aurantimonas aggregata TaxID=2047720 RepID=A0A6L9MMH9_9HYPH|nr:PQQ-dependent sugar dehydrogenase [Aurantimonas aggregata]NDV89057.1 PQQ-dependent sugar dehydrogenase [Aurantimonas aggregata]
MRLPAAILATTFLVTPSLAQSVSVPGTGDTSLTATPVAEFDEPWAMTFLPDGAMLVTEKPGNLQLVTQDGEMTEVSGVPEVAYGGQGGFGDVVLHPAFAENGVVYISYAEPGNDGTQGAAVARATFDASADEPALSGLEVVWRQEPKVTGNGHYSHRIAFGPDGMMFISSGDRQKLTPAQDMAQSLGKIIRLNDDGSVPADNPIQNQGELAKSFWSVGHRNVLGIAFDADGRLWDHEMGPRGGDELNLVEAGENYGWPEVSNGVHYDGRDIPDHSTNTEDFVAPVESWTPVISPAGFVIYSGEMFPDWQGSGLIGGLSALGLVRVTLGDDGGEVERFDMGARIREVEQGPDGAVWVLEDGPGGRLLKLTPESES